MTRFKNAILIAGCTALAVLLLAYLAFYWSAANKRKAALENLEKPEGYLFYEALQAELKGPEVAMNTPWPGPISPDQALENLAAWQRILDYSDSVLATDPAYDAYSLNLLDPGYEWTAADFETVQRLAVEHAAFAADVRAAAAAGGPVYALKFQDGPMMELPHLARVRNLARFMRAYAIAHAHTGDADAAAHDILTMLQLGDTLRYESLLIDQLVRIAIVGITFGAAKEWLDAGALSDEVLAELAEYLESGYSRDAFADAFLGEALIAKVSFDQIREDPALFGQVFSPSDSIGWRASSGSGTGQFDPLQEVEEWVEAGVLKLYPSPIMRPWMDNDEGFYFEQIIRYSKLAERPYYEIHGELETIDIDFDNPPPIRLMSNILLPALSRAIAAQARAEAMIDLMRLGAYADRYRHQEGHPAESLDVIGEYFGIDMPIDPFSGHAYQYRPDGDGYLLYSIGHDLADDGGLDEVREGDIVWRGTAEPRSSETPVAID